MKIRVMLAAVLVVLVLASALTRRRGLRGIVVERERKRKGDESGHCQ